MRGSLSLKKRLGFERLEARTVLNGTVMVGTEGSALGIIGDASSNYYLVQQTGTTAGGGVNVRVTGFATKIDNLNTGKTGTSFTFTGVTSITVNETAGGSNHITIAGVNIGTTGDLSVTTGDGNNILTVVNVKSNDASFDFGNGNDVASFVNLSTAGDGDISIDAGNGRDVVVLNNVHAGTSSSPGDLSVDMGSGSHDVLSVALSSAGDASFSTGGSNSILVWKHTGNHFTMETDTGFSIVV
jgi:hypothetical protein